MEAKMEENCGESEKRHTNAISYWQEKDRKSQDEIRSAREISKVRTLTGLIGGIILGSLLTAYCWIPSNMSVKDINKDGRYDVVVEQMNGAERNYLQQQNGNYKLDTKYLDDLITITPW